MSSRKRIKTAYPGIFYREAKRIGGPGLEKVYYAVFKESGKVVEEKVGRQFQDAMTPAKAAIIRGQLIEGKRKTKKEKKAESALKKWTIVALWTEYTEYRQKTRSFESDKQRYQTYIAGDIGNKEPGELLPLDVERIKLRMKKQGKAPQTIKHVLGLLKRIVNFGSNHGLCSNLKFKIGMPDVDNRKTEDLTQEELERLIVAIESDQNRAAAAIMKLALFTGMRKGEIFKLQWKDINFHRGFIQIVSPKGGKTQEIPLNKEAEKLLKSWPETPNSPYVFPGVDGKQRVSISKAAKRIRETAGLPADFRPLHGLRHVYASMLASSGKVDIYTIQRLLTHKSPSMTQRYAHLRDDALKKAAELAGNIINEHTEKANKQSDGNQNDHKLVIRDGK